MERDMEYFRRRMIEDMPAERKKLMKSEDEAQYVKERHMAEQNDQYINGVKIRQQVVDSVKEKDGVRVPYTRKEIYCEPACDLETLEKYVDMKETTDEQE
jgi:hypothetical protein